MAYRKSKDNAVTRFHRRIVKDPHTGCWEWTGAQAGNGYGQSWYGGVCTTAHRAYWMCVRGAIPEGVDLDHLCRNRSCVNPDHMEPVSRSENLERGYEARGCVNGHPYTEEGFSVVTRSNGQTFRRCKICHRDINRRSKRRRSRGKFAQREGSEKPVTFRGETKTRTEWAEIIGISTMGLKYRLEHWTLERAMTEAPNK